MTSKSRKFVGATKESLVIVVVRLAMMKVDAMALLPAGAGVADYYR